MSGRLRAAVIGAGWYAAQNHIPALARRDDVVLDGVCRLGADDLERVRAHFGFAFASEDYREVLARRPDVVVVASPHPLHHAQARAALEAGAHVLCEKPMTLDPAEAWDLVALAEARGRHLLIANGYQCLPRVAEIADRIAGGAVGEIEHAVVSFVSATRDVFVGERGLDSWKTTFFRPERSTWQEPANGGGFAYGQMSHALAMLFFLSGRAPRRIAAQTVGNAGIDIAEAGTLLLDNGAVVAVSGAAGMPQGNRGLLRLIISGSEGLMTIDFDRDLCDLRRFDGTVERFDPAPDGWIYNCVGPVDALVDLAQGRGRNQSPGVVGARTTATIAALLRSAKAGGAPVEIDDRAAPSIA